MKLTNEEVIQIYNLIKNGAFADYDDTIFRYKISKLERVLEGPIKDISAVQPNRADYLGEYDSKVREFTESRLDVEKTSEANNGLLYFKSSEDAKEFADFRAKLDEEFGDKIKEYEDLYAEFSKILPEEVEVEFKPFSLESLPNNLGKYIEALEPIIED
jgi:hypothetical protein